MSETQWPKLKEKLENSADTQVFQISFDAGEKIPYLVRLKYKGVVIDLLASLTPYQDISNLDFPYIEKWAREWEVSDQWEKIRKEVGVV